ncbi:flippase-like domain-containing protein [Vibrio fluvialis]|nr:flippase-like domain-containing protein [Vibrio fluvialis]
MVEKLASNRIVVTIFLILTTVYIMAMIAIDDSLQFDIFESITIGNIGVIVLLFCASIMIRYIRWLMLMRNHNVEHNFNQGLLFYVSGFAYTATPGKIGELSRAIHYNTIGVPSYIVISCFIIERFFDLIAVLLLSSIVFINIDGLSFVAFAILFIISIVLWFIADKRLLKMLCKLGLRLKIKKLTRLLVLFYVVFNNIRSNISYRQSFICLLLGLIAWSMTALILVYSCYLFKLDIDFSILYSIYPVAMLSGAVSFIPGGIGATEAVIVMLLSYFDTPVAIASLIAIIVRFSTLWLAILVGMFCTVKLSLSAAYTE